jgi:DNA-binding HxlR family transcriptional regulator
MTEFNTEEKSFSKLLMRAEDIGVSWLPSRLQRIRRVGIFERRD